MPRNIRSYQSECESLLKRITDEETRDRFEAAIERFWDDQVSLMEMADDLREELRLQRLFS